MSSSSDHPAQASIPRSIREETIVRLPSGVFAERRSSREYVRVPISFECILGSRRCVGVYISLRSIFVQGHLVSELDFETPIEVCIRLPLSGYVLELRIVGRALRFAPQETLLEIEIDDFLSGNSTVYARVVRMLLAGIVPSPEDILNDLDSETEVVPVEEVTAGRLRGIMLFVLYGMILTCGFLFLGTIIYQRSLQITFHGFLFKTSEIEITSHASGVIKSVVSDIGGYVNRDQPILELSDRNLASEIAIAEAKVKYLSAIINGRVRPGSGSYLGQKTVESTDGLNSFATELEYAEAVLTAYRTRESDLTVFSPCDCLVSWAVEKGARVQHGDRLLVLSDRKSRIAVLATVDMDRLDEVELGDTAIFRVLGSEFEFSAVLSEINSVGPARSAGREHSVPEVILYFQPVTELEATMNGAALEGRMGFW
jgi:mannuronan synthase